MATQIQNAHNVLMQYSLVFCTSFYKPLAIQSDGLVTWHSYVTGVVK